MEDPHILLDTNSEGNDINTTEFPIITLLGERSKRRNNLKLESPNPIYAPEEFTYVPDPEEIRSNNINVSGDDDDDDEEKNPVFIDNFENLRHINFRLTEDNDEYKYEDNQTFDWKCKELEEPGGFCVTSSGYPSELISSVMENCSSLVSTFQAVVPDELEGLGDTSESVITSEKDEERPWSWRVYAYKKRQACDSEVSLVLPSYAVDSGGELMSVSGSRL